MTELDWWNLIEESPGNQDVLEGFALWLRDEKGDDVGATCAGWVADRHLVPDKSVFTKRFLSGWPPPTSWDWWTADCDYADDTFSVIPMPVFLMFENEPGSGYFVEFASIADAYCALFVAFGKAWAGGWRPEQFSKVIEK